MLLPFFLSKGKEIFFLQVETATKDGRSRKEIAEWRKEHHNHFVVILCDGKHSRVYWKIFS
jgi:hypothetical protein